MWPEFDPDPEKAKKAMNQVELLTPLVKAHLTDFGYILIRDAIQVLGCRVLPEFPVEQYAGMKKLSASGGHQLYPVPGSCRRKLGMEGGKVFQDWIQEAMAFTSQYKEDPDFGRTLSSSLRRLRLPGIILCAICSISGAGSSA